MFSELDVSLRLRAWQAAIMAISSEVSFQFAKVEVNTKDLDIVSKVRGWLMSIEI